MLGYIDRYRSTDAFPVGTTRTGVWIEQPAKTSLAPLPPAYTLYGPHGNGADIKRRADDGNHGPFAAEKAKSLSTQPEQALASAERKPTHARSPSANALTQKAQLVPLRLGPIILSDEPQTTPTRSSLDADDLECATTQQRPRSDSTQELLEDARRRSYRETRETPIQLYNRLSIEPSAAASRMPCESAGFQGRPQTSRSLKTQASRQSLASTLRRQATETGSTPASGSSDTVRPRARLQRKRSDQSARRSQLNLIEQEVFELKSIVGHRRAAGAREDTPDDHVPAVAPAMQVRARTETLSDIGSAFCRPATARGRSYEDNPPGTKSEQRDSQTPQNTNGAGSRVSGWLSNIMTSSSSIGSLRGNEPFYKCTPPAHTRPVSHASLCSSTTDLDSPGLTLASSPTATSKGHSRSLTAESRVTPMSPVEDTYDALDGQRQSEKTWAPDAADVGLAI